MSSAQLAKLEPSITAWNSGGPAMMPPGSNPRPYRCWPRADRYRAGDVGRAVDAGTVFDLEPLALRIASYVGPVDDDDKPIIPKPRGIGAGAWRELCAIASGLDVEAPPIKVTYQPGYGPASTSTSSSVPDSDGDADRDDEPKTGPDDPAESTEEDVAPSCDDCGRAETCTCADEAHAAYLADVASHPDPDEIIVADTVAAAGHVEPSAAPVEEEPPPTVVILPERLNDWLARLIFEEKADYARAYATWLLELGPEPDLPADPAGWVVKCRTKVERLVKS